MLNKVASVKVINNLGRKKEKLLKSVFHFMHLKKGFVNIRNVGFATLFVCVCSGAGEGRGKGGARELSEANTYPFRPNKGVHPQDHITSFLKAFSKALAICN